MYHIKINVCDKNFSSKKSFVIKTECLYIKKNDKWWWGGGVMNVVELFRKAQEMQPPGANGAK